MIHGDTSAVLNFAYPLCIYIYIWLDLQKHGYRNLSHVPSDRVLYWSMSFFSLTFYLANLYRLFTE